MGELDPKMGRRAVESQADIAANSGFGPGQGVFDGVRGQCGHRRGDGFRVAFERQTQGESVGVEADIQTETAVPGKNQHGGRDRKLMGGGGAGRQRRRHAETPEHARRIIAPPAGIESATIENDENHPHRHARLRLRRRVPYAGAGQRQRAAGRPE